MKCPFAGNIFDELIVDLDENSEGAVVKDVVENVIEQMTTEVFDKKITGVKQRSRDRLERLRLRTDFSACAEREEALIATIDIAKEIDDQGYVFLEEFRAEYLIPWLEVMEVWLCTEYQECPCTSAAYDALQRLY